MTTLTGLEKFSSLEDKIYLTVDYVKKLREEKDRLETETKELRDQVIAATAERHDAEERVATLLKERDTILLKVESMLDVIAAIDTEVAAVVNAKANGK